MDHAKKFREELKVVRDKLTIATYFLSIQDVIDNLKPIVKTYNGVFTREDIELIMYNKVHNFYDTLNKLTTNRKMAKELTYILKN